MMYVFESSEGLVYNNPDSYILSRKNQMVEWGDKLKVYPVYKKGSRAIGGYQKIQAMFYHEGEFSTLDTTYWQPVGITEGWYRPNGNVEVVNNYKVVSFDFGIDSPKYFLTKKDVAWYIEHIHDLYQPFVIDEYDNSE